VASAKVSVVEDLLAGFVGDRARVSEVTDLALREFDRHQPEIWSDPELRELGVRAIAAAMTQFAAVMRGDLTLEQLALAPASAELAIAQVRRGVTIEQALYAAGLAQAASWEVWLRMVSGGDVDAEARAEAVEQVAMQMLRVSNALSQQISKLHADERERWLGSRAARRARAAMELLAGGEGAADELDYELRGPHRAVVVWGDVDEQSTDPDALSAVAREIVGARGLVVDVEARAAWGWGAPGKVAAAAFERAGMRVSLGGVHAGPSGFRESHREAQLARRLAAAMPSGPRVIDHGDVALLALAASDLEAARGFVASLLGPLQAAGPRGLRLARTVQVYLEEQASPRRASHRLAMHENTVIKHVRAAEELLGRRVEERHPELLVALLMASGLGLLEPAGEQGRDS
jgi:DNA-binding PucR family transcriptional regulator